MIVEEVHQNLMYVKSIILSVVTELDVEIEKEEDSIIVLSYSGDFFSFGNQIEIDLHEKSKNLTEIRILSKSAFPLQIIDWGTNSELEEYVYQSLKQELSI